ncbi:cupin domain-containing protein [Streptomyces vietnamensis]|uniref:cupin domain-containing protein n=1 Tax=Streptomyces vietnamensis TaxID=362257 RepID=UPI000696CE28|nr:cupin domain-containing protein [Streptomyces vietnamensis]
MPDPNARSGGPVTCLPDLPGPDGIVLSEHDLSGIPAPFSSSVFVLPPGTSTDVDLHDVVETWFVGSGEGRLEHEGKAHLVVTGDSFHFASREPHRVHNTGSTPLTVFSVWWSA